MNADSLRGLTVKRDRWPAARPRRVRRASCRHLRRVLAFRLCGFPPRGALGAFERIRVGHGDHGHVDLVVGSAEADEFVAGHVCAQVVHVPVRLAECHGRHRRRQGVPIACDRRDHHGAPSPTAGVGEQIAEHPLDDRRRPVLDPDCEVAVVPRLADRSQRWRNHVFDQFDDSRALVHEATRNLADLGFVADQQCRMHSLRLAVQPRPARGVRGLRAPTVRTDLGDVARRDEVPAAGEPSRQPAAAYPAVRRLVVHAEGVRCGLQLQHRVGVVAHGRDRTRRSTNVD